MSQRKTYTARMVVEFDFEVGGELSAPHAEEAAAELGNQLELLARFGGALDLTDGGAVSVPARFLDVRKGPALLSEGLTP